MKNPFQNGILIANVLKREGDVSWRWNGWINCSPPRGWNPAGRSRRRSGGALVLVNSAAARSPDLKIDPDRDQVTVEGTPVLLKKNLYLMLNKPQGVVSATEDPHQPTVVDLVPQELRRKGLFPAGRLDKDTEGFVLITDDGSFAHRILSPKNHVPKTYLARLDRAIDPSVAVEFQKGVRLTGEDQCSPAQLTILEPGDNPLVEVVIHEGM